MYYFEFNIGDYCADTMHLTMLEHGAYNILIQKYYLSECALTLDFTRLARMCGARTDDEKQAVLNVLEEFFERTEIGWVHNRCQKDINKYHAKLEVQVSNGKKGGRPRKKNEEANNQHANVAKSEPDEPLIDETVVDVVDAVIVDYCDDDSAKKPLQTDVETTLGDDEVLNLQVVDTNQPFRMFLTWHPKDRAALDFILRQCRVKGADSDEFAEALIEFNQYWLKQDVELTELEWVHKLTQSIQAKKVRANGKVAAVSASSQKSSSAGSAVSKSEQALTTLEVIKQKRLSGESSGILPPSIFAELVFGMQSLLSLSLDGRPSADTISATVYTWENILAGVKKNSKWDAKLDKDRIKKAFEKIAATAKRFPAPEEVLSILPMRSVSMVAIEKKHTPEELQKMKEDNAKGKEKLSEIMKVINKNPAHKNGNESDVKNG